MRIRYIITLLSLIITNWGFSSNCIFTINPDIHEDILAIYLDTFNRNNVQSTLDIFTIQVNHEGSDCGDSPYTIEYTLKIYAPEIGLNRYETFYIGLGFLVGVGYAHPITDGTRLALNVNYAIRRMEGESWKTLGISLGGLF